MHQEITKAKSVTWKNDNKLSAYDVSVGKRWRDPKGLVNE